MTWWAWGVLTVLNLAVLAGAWALNRSARRDLRDAGRRLGEARSIYAKVVEMGGKK